MGNLMEIVDDDDEEEVVLDMADDVAATSATPDPSLHRAAAQGNVKLLQELTASGVAIDAKDAEGNTPLHVAAMFGKVDACEWLMERGRAVHAVNGKGDSPAMVARAFGFDELAQRLEAREKEAFRKEEMRKFEEEREALFAELDRKKATIDQLRASERRLRIELDWGSKERLRLLLLGGGGIDGAGGVAGEDFVKDSLAEALVTENERMVAIKATRDALAAELASCDNAFSALERALAVPATSSKDALSARIHQVTRRIISVEKQR